MAAASSTKQAEAAQLEALISSLPDPEQQEEVRRLMREKRPWLRDAAKALKLEPFHGKNLRRHAELIQMIARRINEVDYRRSLRSDWMEQFTPGGNLLKPGHYIIHPDISRDDLIRLSHPLGLPTDTSTPRDIIFARVMPAARAATEKAIRREEIASRQVTAQTTAAAARLTRSRYTAVDPATAQLLAQIQFQEAARATAAIPDYDGWKFHLIDYTTLSHKNV